jgi:hypothetical protein
MITIGIHIGYFSIRISQSYKSSSDSRIHFDAVEWPSHASTEWYACYGGALPNAYDAASGKVGYDAIDTAGLANACRLDSAFFRDVLRSGEPHERACEIWTGFLRLLRRCPTLRFTKDAVKGALLLDGIDVSPAASKWRPWHRGTDRTPELLEQLRALGPRAGFAEFEIVSNRSAAERYVATQVGVRVGDLVAMVGSANTSLWMITEPKVGGLKPVLKTQGIEHLLRRLKKSRELNSDTLKKLLGLLQGAERELGTWLDLVEWQKNRLFPTLEEAFKELPIVTPSSSRRLLVVGEGAALLQGLSVRAYGLQVEEWQTDHVLAPACGAAAVALQHSMESKE